MLKLLRQTKIRNVPTWKQQSLCEALNALYLGMLGLQTNTGKFGLRKTDVHNGRA